MMFYLQLKMRSRVKNLLYTDVNSNIDIYAALYNEKEKKLDYIDNPKDQKMIEEVMKIVKEKMS